MTVTETTTTITTTPDKTEERISTQKEEEEEEEEEEEQEQEQGFYSDGVYIARPTTTTNGDALEDETAETDAQTSYYALLRRRFLLLRSTLRCSPPASAVAALDDNHPISLPRNSKAARSEWRRLLLAVDPQMVQLACMDMDSVLGVLSIMARLMSENVKSGDAARVRRIGAWAWGLLGRCRDVGQMSSEEVGEIRDLGKRAAKILGKMREERQAATAAQQQQRVEESDEYREDSRETGEGDEEVPVQVNVGADVQQHPADHIKHQDQEATEGDVEPMDISFSHHQDTDGSGEPEPRPEDLEAAKARLQAMLKPNQEPEQRVEQKETASRPEVQPEAAAPEKEKKKSLDAIKQTRAMLDMILTVVGEFYGQRDLLDAREIWDEDMMW